MLSGRNLALAIRVVAILLLPGLLGGCSVVMASKKPPKKNLAVLRPGTNRDTVVAELGAPVSSQRLPQGRSDVYVFVQGYSTASKTTQIVFNGTADLFSFGLWEAAGTPIEANLDGKKITVRVVYDVNDRIVTSNTLDVGKP